MNNVDLDVLSNNGVENIFSHSNAVDRFGEENITKWVKMLIIKILKFHI